MFRYGKTLFFCTTVDKHRLLILGAVLCCAIAHWGCRIHVFSELLCEAACVISHITCSNAMTCMQQLMTSRHTHAILCSLCPQMETEVTEQRNQLWLAPRLPLLVYPNARVSS
jgi:hypothetical protein